MSSREVTNEYRMRQWMQVIRDREGSGEKIDAYCEKKGIKRHTYYYWQRKLRETAGKHLAQQQEPTGISISRFTEVRVLEGSDQAPNVEEAEQIQV